MIDPRLAQSMLNVLSALQAREGSRMPSHAVQLAAVHIPVSNIAVHTGLARIYKIDGSRGLRYPVILYMDEHSPCYDCGAMEVHDGSCRYASSGDDTDPVLDAERLPAVIIDAECTCDAGRSHQTCKHLLRALAEADRDGHKLKS